MASPPGDTLAGTQAGVYQIESLIGRGAMGDVYRARHPVLGREMAVKVLNREATGDESLVRRFRREAMSVNRIGHSAIVEVFDFGTLPDGRCYAVMEYLQGYDLGEVLDSGGAVRLDRTVGIIVPVMDALAAAHQAGIIHRDIKPDNIFLHRGKDGLIHPKVLDFGIAKLVAAGEEISLVSTGAGQLFGTPLYMSPEQAAGDNHRIGPWTDLYSVGVVLFTMLTGHPPFSGKTFSDILLKHLQTPAPTLASAGGAVPPGVDAFVQRCLAKRPEDRYQTMHEAIGALLAAVEGRATAAAPPRGDPYLPSSGEPPRVDLVVDTKTPEEERIGESSLTGATGQTLGEAPPPRSVASPRRRRTLLALGLGGGLAVVVAIILIAVVGKQHRAERARGEHPRASLARASNAAPPRREPVRVSPVPSMRATGPDVEARRISPAPEVEPGSSMSSPSAAVPRRPARHERKHPRRRTSTPDSPARGNRPPLRPPPDEPPPPPSPPSTDSGMTTSAAPGASSRRLTGRQIHKGVAPILGAARACYNQYRVGGTCRVRVTISGASGRVSRVMVIGSFAGSPTGRCVCAAFRRAQFPTFEASSQSFVFPIIFQ